MDIWPRVRTADNTHTQTLTHIHTKDPPVKAVRAGREGAGKVEGEAGYGSFLTPTHR